MPLAFTKMHGLGNDFVVIDAVRQTPRLEPARVQRIADRRLGVGCDQLLLVEAARDGADFGFRIFNADGGEVEQCGNGARCVARFVRAQGLSTERRLTFATRGGPIRTELLDDERVAVDMGVPRFDPETVPFLAAAAADEHPLEVEGREHRVGVVSMGNPHAVLRVDDASTAPVAQLGPRIETHARFPARTNVGFLQIDARDRVRLRVWERGVGETAACGTGACAAVATGRRLGLLDERVTVTLNGGPLVIEWTGGDNRLWMTGPATTVYEGTFFE